MLLFLNMLLNSPYLLAYSAPSSLFWVDKVIQSMEGVQQGDSLGPLLFCFSIYQTQSQLQSELRLLYVDNITIGGSLKKLLHDLQVIEKGSQDLGMTLNHYKSKIVCGEPTICASLTSAMLNATINCGPYSCHSPGIFLSRHFFCL